VTQPQWLCSASYIVNTKLVALVTSYWDVLNSSSIAFFVKVTKHKNTFQKASGNVLSTATVAVLRPWGSGLKGKGVAAVYIAELNIYVHSVGYGQDPGSTDVQ
jgi:hypothetical protein